MWTGFVWFLFLGQTPFTKLWSSPKQPPVYTKALTWLSSWVTKVDFALLFFGGWEFTTWPHYWLLDLNRYFVEALSIWLYRKIMTTISGCWFNATRGWNASEICFLWENSNFSMEHVHNFDHLICSSTLHFYSNFIFLPFWETHCHLCGRVLFFIYM